jgi:photosystem II protein
MGHLLLLQSLLLIPMTLETGVYCHYLNGSVCPPLAYSCTTQVLTGNGALAQFGCQVGLDASQVNWFIVALIGFNAIAAVLPTSGTFVPEERESLNDRPKGPLQDPRISILEPKKFFGITNFGFTKANELFVGRVAQLGFAAALVLELMTGNGPLTQLNFGE